MWSGKGLTIFVGRDLEEDNGYPKWKSVIVHSVGEMFKNN